MRALDIITKKRDGREISFAEIEFMINGYVADKIPDYQMSAFLMAIYLRGMTEKETTALTLVMASSGDQLDLSIIPDRKVDKHSTGGVGDKTTLIVAPLVAAAGIPVAKMSGRALGHSGGTIDKLESIPGFAVELTQTQFVHNVLNIGLVVAGQTGNLVPADKKIYALRDATATVASIPLIASSIMSKKIAAATDAIVLDVKCGRGAFMPDLNSAEKLGATMVDIGRGVGLKTVAVISNMDQPLGRAVGNALEVKEAIDVLQNKGPADTTELSLTLGSYMVMLAGKADSATTGKKMLTEILTNGLAWQKFREFIGAQGGDLEVVDNPSQLPAARHVLPVRSELSGFVAEVCAEVVGQISMELGAGRATKEDIVDPAVGIVIQKKIGDIVTRGDVLAEIHASSNHAAKQAIEKVRRAFRIVSESIPRPPLVHRILQ